MAFRHELRVRYGECDPQGIVYNAHYLAFIDIAFTELWRHHVGPWMEMTARGYDAVLAEARLGFRAPARFDDDLGVELDVARLGRASIHMRAAIRRGDELLLDGELRHVVVSTQTWTSVEMPDWIRSGLASIAPD
jgi:acyl-CoA thioester hydrolase